MNTSESSVFRIRINVKKIQFAFSSGIMNWIPLWVNLNCCFQRWLRDSKKLIKIIIIILCLSLSVMFTGGRIKALVEGLQMIALSKHNQKKSEMRFSGNYVLPSEDMIKGRIHLIKDDFYKHIKINKKFASSMMLCEFLNFINLMVQIHLTNVFLAGQFYSLGFKFIEDDFVGSMDVLDIVFPKVTKCNFYKYGQSGSIQRHDALCVMALNIIHEKIYVILWFWYIIMAVVTVGSIFWRFMSLALFSR